MPMSFSAVWTKSNILIGFPKRINIIYKINTCANSLLGVNFKTLKRKLKLLKSIIIELKDIDMSVVTF